MRSCTSLCRMIVTPPVGHERACSVVKAAPQTHSWQVGWCPVVAKAECITKCTFVKCKAMGSNWEGSHPAVGTLLASQFSSSL